MRMAPLVILVAIATTSISCIQGGAEALSAVSGTTSTIVPTDLPPLFDVPVWSMATLNDGDSDVDNNPRKKTTNMNLLTYATPVAIRPNRLYALGLYKQTKSRDNFLREKTCILQLLSSESEEHISSIRLLGGTSGKEVDKEEEFSSVLGIELQKLPDDSEKDNGEVPQLPKVLPGCVRYLKLSMVGDDVVEYDGGENCHDVAICRVDKMWTSSSPSSTEDGEKANPPHLSTGRLRELGLITEQGRIAPLPEE